MKVRGAFLKKLKKLYYPQKESLLKLYDSFLVEKGFLKNSLSIFYDINGEKFQEYNYIYAEELSTKNLSDYILFKDFIKKVNSDFRRPKVGNSQFDIFNEIKNYREYLIKHKEVWDSDFYDSFSYIDNIFITLYKDDGLRNKQGFLSHGDLHNKNILVDSQKTFYIIDYDEVCYAPKDFDLVIFIFRFFKQRMKNIDFRLLDLIVKELKNEQLDVNLLKLYFIKVILQKKFLEYSGTMSKEEILYDNWKKWYEDLIVFNSYLRSRFNG